MLRGKKVHGLSLIADRLGRNVLDAGLIIGNHMETSVKIKKNQLKNCLILFIF